jgi:putative SOS response-associated peptidase YedK
MCGRFALYASPERIQAYFELPETPALDPSWNIAPSQPIATIQQTEAGERRFAFCRWGFLPHWASEGSGHPAPINARAETVANKPTFRAAFQRQRCLIPANGYYEWQKTPDGKQPVYFKPAEGDLLAFAGLWTMRVTDDGRKTLRTAAIITTVANENARAVHHRMPAILPPDAWRAWLNPTLKDAAAVQPFLGPAPEGALTHYAVSTEVNSPQKNDRTLIRPLSS